MRILEKVLQAIGTAEAMIGLTTGLNRDLTKEMHFAAAGIAVFAVGWFVYRRTEKRSVLN
jgi:hypothetical protein